MSPPQVAAVQRVFSGVCEAALALPPDALGAQAPLGFWDPLGKS